MPGISAVDLARTNRLIADWRARNAGMRSERGKTIASAEGRRKARLAYARNQGFTEAETRAFLAMDRAAAHRFVVARGGGFETRSFAAAVRLR
jgi:hypothetical protein